MGQVFGWRGCCSFQLALQSEPNKLTISAWQKGRGCTDDQIHLLAAGGDYLFIQQLVAFVRLDRRAWCCILGPAVTHGVGTARLLNDGIARDIHGFHEAWGKKALGKNLRRSKDDLWQRPKLWTCMIVGSRKPGARRNSKSTTQLSRRQLRGGI